VHITLVTPPAAEPVTLTEARLHCRIDSTAEDALLSMWITAAREEAEVFTQRTIPAQTWKISLDRFPFYDGSSQPRYSTLGVGAYEWLEARRIRLPRPPLVSVSGITYVDTFGNLQTLDPTLYLASADREPGTIEPAYGQVWPVSRYQADSVLIQYVAGWPCTTVALAIASGSQTVTPGSMAGIVAGSILGVDSGATAEQVVVSGVTGTTFTATFAQSHLAGVTVRSVPSRILSAMLLSIGWKYLNREPSKAEFDRWESLLSSAHSGIYP
jgi:hypothetical protein